MCKMSYRNCPGCNKLFSLPGLKHHLDRTTQVDCIAAQDKIATWEENSTDGGESDQPESSCRSSPLLWMDQDDLESDDGDPIAFEGDYYGQYEALAHI